MPDWGLRSSGRQTDVEENCRCSKSEMGEGQGSEEVGVRYGDLRFLGTGMKRSIPRYSQFLQRAPAHS
jgi:hypothetical protein